MMDRASIEGDNMKRTAVLVAVVIVAVASFNFDAAAKTMDPEVQGRELVKTIWAFMRAKSFDKLEKMMAPGFQSVHDDGARDRAAEIALIKRLDMGKVRITDIKVTGSGSALITTYNVATEETIESNRLPKKPAPRLSIFVKTDDGWKWAAHANLNLMK